MLVKLYILKKKLPDDCYADLKHHHWHKVELWEFVKYRMLGYI
jgi:hypothetical protein